jgi:aquaporin Z
LTALTALRQHWPEYLIEGWALGTFMVSAGVVATLLGYPGSPLHAAIPDPDVRRVLGGVAMGLTAIAIIYSPLGKRSGAHMNPAVTLTFLRLGKVARWDAIFYMAAQFIGGTFGVLLVWALLGSAFASPPVAFAATLPGSSGTAVALLAEFLISMGMMLMILFATNRARLAPFTGLFAGVLVAAYIGLEEPLSGMSMNPARSFASAAPACAWMSMWVYFVAPVAGMLCASLIYCAWRGAQTVGCAKLLHPSNVRCIHCGYRP